MFLENKVLFSAREFHAESSFYLRKGNLVLRVTRPSESEAMCNNSTNNDRNNQIISTLTVHFIFDYETILI